jgi:hypothetical protein
MRKVESRKGETPMRKVETRKQKIETRKGETPMQKVESRKGETKIYISSKYPLTKHKEDLSRNLK